MADAETEEEPRYNPYTCITAGELRAMKVPIPASIPDVGWVPMTAIHWGPTTGGKVEGDLVTIDLSVSFSEEFRWLEVTYTLDEEKKT